MKILHVLDHYKPHFSGYAFRSSYILKNQRELGLEPVVITSPKHGSYAAPVEEFDGIRVYRTPCEGLGNLPFVHEVRLMQTLGKGLEEVIAKEKPDLVHAHSPSLNGWPALRAARRHGLPMTYEIRAFWEDAAVDKGSFREGDVKYRLSRQIETSLMRRVDAVFPICEGLRGEIMGRGIAAEKLTVIPNCVDLAQFQPVPYDQEIAARYGLQGKFVFGFIGSHYYFEGLDYLIRAFTEVIKTCPQACALVAGDGPAFQEWVELVKSLGLEKQVLFIGRVPHEEVARFYSVMDAMVYPRINMRLTDLVTPLKPLEAMALGKVVIGSDVGGIKELVEDQKTGFLFKAEDAGDLAGVMLDVLTQSGTLDTIRSNALDYVKAERAWRTVAERYLPVYESLVSRKV